MQIVDEKIRERWKNYLWQSTAAGLSIILILAFFTPIEDLTAVIVAAAGATAFTVFCIPNHVTATPRNVIGGQAIGTATGLLCSFIPMVPLQGGIAVGIAAGLMVILDAEHPPAAGTALGLAIGPTPVLGLEVGPTIERALFILSAAVIFSLIRRALIDELEDLT